MDERFQSKADLFAKMYGQEDSKITDVVEIDFADAELRVASLYSKPSLAEVFAMNIQVSQMKEIIPQYEWKPERFEEERKYFLWWLQQPNLGGKYNFKDNLTAWETYKFSHEIIEFDDDEEFTPSWAEEIDQAISNAIRYANYNDFGGQL